MNNPWIRFAIASKLDQIWKPFNEAMPRPASLGRWSADIPRRPATHDGGDSGEKAGNAQRRPDANAKIGRNATDAPALGAHGADCRHLRRVRFL
jgi:hypothetical protein